MRRVFAILCCAVIASSSCTTTGGLSMFKSRDYADPAEQASEPWVSKVAEEGRAGRPRESSGEPEWFHNLMTSERARDIEHNFGIYD
jgi:hypothetical protein